MDNKFDVILMNPPYGGTEKKSIQQNFPTELRNSETADLFMVEIVYRLKKMMYEKKEVLSTKIIYTYYDIYTGKVIETVNVGG